MLPDETQDHAGRAAEHLLALVAATEPTHQPTAEQHDAVTDLVRAIARALAAARQPG